MDRENKALVILAAIVIPLVLYNADEHIYAVLPSQ